MKWLIISVLTFSFFFTLDTANSYVLYGYKWKHPVTYCSDPDEVTAMKMWLNISGLQDGGVSSTPDIGCVHEQLSPGEGGYAQLNADPVSGSMNSCMIHINTLWSGLLAWVHETGHCLGLAHSCEMGQRDCTLLERQAIMAWDGGFAGINSDDIAAIQALYGPYIPPAPAFFKLVVPNASRD